MPAEGNDRKFSFCITFSSLRYDREENVFLFIMRKLLIVLLALQSVILFAQDSEDSVKGTLAKEVIVTGYPSEESTTPAPIEKVDGRELKQAGDFKDVPNILSQLPSVV